MAIELLSGTDRLEMGDISELANITALSFALKVRTKASIATDERLMGQWGNSTAERCFLVTVTNNDEIGFVVHNNNNFWGRQTNDSPLATSSELNIAGAWDYNSGSPFMKFYVNGSLRSEVSWFSNAVTNTQDATSTTFVGYEVKESQAGMDGDYSDIALWDTALDDAQLKALSLGYSPAFFRNNGIMFIKGFNTDHLVDEWGGYTVTNTGGSNAQHLPVIEPNRVHSYFPPAPAVAGSNLPVFHNHYVNQGMI